MKVNTFLVGSQKTATTWLYVCLKDHPDIYAPERDTLNYFSLNFYKDIDWYHNFYKSHINEKIVIDTSPTYSRDDYSAKRIYDYNKDSKLIFILRNPIQRSFSHYWHEKRKGNINYSFEDALEYNGIGNYDLYSNWVLSSFYFRNLKPYFNTFERKQIHVIIYDDLVSNPIGTLTNIYHFLEIDECYISKYINKRINDSKDFIVYNKKVDPNEYTNGLSKTTIQKLKLIFQDEIKNLESLLNIDLKLWL